MRMPELREERPEVGTCVELFAGGGGLAMAVHAAGFRPLLVNEYAKRACESLRNNPPDPSEPEKRWPLVPGDVRDIVNFRDHVKGDVDVLAGGPPCQPFSLGGAHKGMEDERNMFPEMFRAIRELSPKAVICENVRGLLRPSFKPYFEYILNEMRLPFVKREKGVTWEEHNDVLEKLIANDTVEPSQRYVVKEMEVNAADYGVPQIRNRVIIVAFRADLGINWEQFMPKATHSEESMIHSMREGGPYWQRHNVDASVRKRVIDNLPELDHEDEKVKEKLKLDPWRTLRDAIAGIDENEGKPLPPVSEEEVKNKVVVGGIPDHVGGARTATASRVSCPGPCWRTSRLGRRGRTPTSQAAGVRWSRTRQREPSPTLVPGSRRGWRRPPRRRTAPACRPLVTSASRPGCDGCCGIRAERWTRARIGPHQFRLRA